MERGNPVSPCEEARQQGFCKKPTPSFRGHEKDIKRVQVLAVVLCAGFFLFCLDWDADARGGGSFGGGSYGSVRQSGVYGSRSVSRHEQPSPDSWENSRDMPHGQYGSAGQHNRRKKRIDDRNSHQEGRTYYQQDLTDYREITDEGKTTYVVVASPFKK